MGGRGGSANAGGNAGDWRAEVADKMHGVALNQSVLFGDEATWPRAHLLSNAAEQAHLEQVLREVYSKMPTIGEGGWVRLPKIRDALAKRGLNRTRQDAAILGLALRPDARVIKIANLKSLSNDDRRAAILFGGDFHHAIRIGHDF